MRFAVVTTVLAAILLLLLALIPDQSHGGIMARPPARMTDKEFNRIITEFLGNPDRRLRVSYRGGGDWHAGKGRATFNVGRIHLLPQWYKAILEGRPSPDLALGMGVLAHEVGHFSPEALKYSTSGGTMNDTGGRDFNPKIPEDMADEYARANLRRLYNVLGFRPHVARNMSQRSRRAFDQFREANPYG